MKALIYNPDDELKLELQEIEKPKLTLTNAIIAVKGVGVCGSDLVKINQNLVSRGSILGHEMVGIIDEISDAMSKKYGFDQGDRIVSSHHVPCLNCKFCLNQQESLCETFKKSNFFPGAFCEYLELSERHLQYTVQKVPDHLTNEEASFTEPLACCIKAIERSGLKNYQGKAKVLVLGLGSIGLLIAQLVRFYRNDFQLNCFDIQDSRLKLAQLLDLDTCLDEDYDFVFLAAGAKASVDTALKLASRGATIIVFASVNSDAVFNNNEIYYKELTVLGSYSPNLTNLKEALDLISSKKILVDKLISHKANLENLAEKILETKNQNGIKAYLSLI
ncbi:MAG: alcohol dehydrogenase catalytic domain-containing protein [Candidatus Caenarcaniphilales bacterium]|jgi:L-iditol 2-dehydrogenase|nr:alcohol dehydrogenase catalytic domain-containing protein [Candidatus Caenarcaniphilales bacterium]